jgi:integrase
VTPNARKGSTYRRGRVWAYRYDLDLVDGKRREVTKSGFATQREAQVALEQTKENVRHGVHVEPSQLTMSQWFDRWIDGLENEVKPSTIGSYRGVVLRYLKPSIGSVLLQRVEPTHVNNVVRSMRERGLSASTVRTNFVILHAALKAAVDVDLIARSPADRVPKPTGKVPGAVRVERVVWTEAQVAEFLAATSSDRFGLMWAVEAGCALRVGELCGLKWSDVNFDAGCVNVTRTVTMVDGVLTESSPKTDSSERTLHVGPGVMGAFREIARRQGNARVEAGEAWTETGYVLTDDGGFPITPSVASKAFRHAVEMSTLPVISIHGLRHSWGSIAHANGATWHDVSKFLGHSSATFTASCYIHPQEGAQSVITARMDELYRLAY